MDDIIVYQLLKTRRRLTFDILYQREDTRYKGDDDSDYFTFRASNGIEIISRSRMDVQTERLWLFGAGANERSGSMVFSSDDKRDKAYDNFNQAIREWVAFIRTGGWGTRPTPVLVVPDVPAPIGLEVIDVGQNAQAFIDEAVVLHSEGFATEADAAALLGLDADALRAKIAERSVFALPEPRNGTYRIPVWALHLDMMGLATLRLHNVSGGSNEWEIHAFMSTPCDALHGLRPFECLVSPSHLPLKIRAIRDAFAAKLKLEADDSLIEVVATALRQELDDNARRAQRHAASEEPSRQGRGSRGN